MDATIIALSKLLAKNLPELAPGQSATINETITFYVNATVKRGEDVEYTPTTSIPLLSTLAFVLQIAGFQRDRAMEVLTKAMTLALNEDANANDEILAYVADIKTATERVQNITEALPKQIRKGATTVKGEVKFIESNQLQAA